MDNYNHQQNLYEFLGAHPKAGPDEIKAAYRSKLKEWHPDKNPNRKEAAEEMTKMLNQAYSILSDPEKRKNYDNMLRFTKRKKFNDINDDTFWSKLSKVSPEFKKTLYNVQELYSLFKDTIKGKFKLHPLTFGVIAGGLLYFINPFDLIPDVIPFIGYMDDIAVLTTIINSFHNELEAYRKWKEATGGETTEDT